MTTDTAATPAEGRWGGGVSPFSVTWQKLMMWLFLVGDMLLFGAFLASYGYHRIAAESWPERSKVFHLEYIAAMTFVLITSSATMATAVSAARKGDATWIRRGLLLTILGGLGFLGMQAYEWSMVIQEGARLNGNPWGVPGFSAFFFTITGFHGTHVLTGVIILLVTFVRRSGSNAVEYAGLYWHFVDLVWVFIFGLFYLI